VAEQKWGARSKVRNLAEDGIWLEVAGAVHSASPAIISKIRI